MGFTGKGYQMNCKHTKGTAERFDVEDTQAWRVITCSDCGLEWLEVFELSHCEDMNGNEIIDPTYQPDN